MVVYVGGFLLWFVYDRVKCKIIKIICGNASIKLLKYTDTWHNGNHKPIIKHVMNFILKDDYF